VQLLLLPCLFSNVVPPLLGYLIDFGGEKSESSPHIGAPLAVGVAIAFASFSLAALLLAALLFAALLLAALTLPALPLVALPLGALPLVALPFVALPLVALPLVALPRVVLLLGASLPRPRSSEVVSLPFLSWSLFRR
jgi:hypothetical protein